MLIRIPHLCVRQVPEHTIPIPVTARSTSLICLSSLSHWNPCRNGCFCGSSPDLLMWLPEGVPPIEVISGPRNPSWGRQNHSVKPVYQKQFLDDMSGPQRVNRPPTRGHSYRSTHTGMIGRSEHRPKRVTATPKQVQVDWRINQNMLKHHPMRHPINNRYRG